MAKKRKKPISTLNKEHQVATQTNTPLKLCYSSQAEKFCATEFKKEPRKAEAIKRELDKLSRSTMQGDLAVVDGEKIELKVMKAGGLNAIRGRQLAVNVGNDRIRMIVCKHGDQMFIARGFVKKDDGKDYIHHCSLAYNTIKSFIKNGVAVEHSKVFPEDSAAKLDKKNSMQFKAKF